MKISDINWYHLPITVFWLVIVAIAAVIAASPLLALAALLVYGKITPMHGAMAIAVGSFLYVWGVLPRLLNKEDVL